MGRFNGQPAGFLLHNSRSYTTQVDNLRNGSWGAPLLSGSVGTYHSLAPGSNPKERRSAKNDLAGA